VLNGADPTTGNAAMAKFMELGRQGAEVFLSPLLVAFIGFVFCVEKLCPAQRAQSVLSVGFIHDITMWFVFDKVVRTVAGLALLLLTKHLWDTNFAFLTLAPAAPGETGVWRLVAAFIVVDFLAWFHHFVRHKVRVFWVFHAVHHSQRQLNMFTDRRVHFMEYLVTRPIVYVPMMVLGLPIEQAFWVGFTTECYTRFYHANVRTNFGPLRHILVTPQSHRIHHSADPRHKDKNFGVIFSIWDRLFGTLWREYDEYPDTGIEDVRFPHEKAGGWLSPVSSYVQQIVYPFRALRHS
jgi:sterol desaturase/sphingolipid hydroxylase (fatty acid hydroxylase superfamily)